ncbi:uncharacterized protein At3g17950-like [Phragmites australis]|uniref:uncharacterized protein At3g17950-like n=1 Tax=Phragmites australis TaxID=29695 RepID=UPI002D772B64|nr:uncharacterized protein At3g17950-like [Phragmites australis]
MAVQLPQRIPPSVQPLQSRDFVQVYEMPTSKQSRRHHRRSTTSPSRHHNQLPCQVPAAYKPSCFSSVFASGRHHHHPSPTSGHGSARAGRAGPMDLDAGMIPTSPSADSSPSSSDLDTESTGSFFPDRSTTLGTLMGVSVLGGAQRRAPGALAGEEREQTQRAAQEEEGEDGRRGGGVWQRRRRRRRRRGRSLGGSWWRLCRDDDGGPPTSLGEFLDMERQLACADFLCDGTGASGRETAAAAAAAASVAATTMFEDGRVRPPQAQQPVAAADERGRWRLLRASEGSSSSTSSLARLPVLLTGICSGGAG